MLHLLEIASVALLFFYMFFAYKRHANAWLFGILGSVFSAILFYKKGFYGSMFLNVIYAFQGVFGYFEWKWKSPNSKPSYQFRFKVHFLIVFASMLLSLLVIKSFVLLNYVEFKYLDIFLAFLSIVATYLEIKKDIACWWYWIVCNIAYSILYLNLNTPESPLYFYSFLMLALGLFSWFALKEWTKNLQTED
jgi:nicotinamide mononucleotide transporter PnuC